MRLVVAVDEAGSSPDPVEYRWDADTDILTAHFAPAAAGAGLTGSLEIEGADGSWIMLDVRGGRLVSIEIAVWPDVKTVAGLTPPAGVHDGIVIVPARASQPGVAAIEVDTRIVAEADTPERTVHFRIGAARPSRAVRASRDILIEVDDTRQIAGIWLLNVPPFPGES